MRGHGASPRAICGSQKGNPIIHSSSRRILSLALFLTVCGAAAILLVRQAPARDISRRNIPHEQNVPAAVALTCNTIIQTYADVGAARYLSADVPLGATDLHPVFAVKGPHDTDAWQTCNPATTCNCAVLPDMSHPGADPADASPRYAAFVSAATTSGGPVIFASPRWIRLVTQYTMGSALCLSQATFEVNAGGDYPVQMFVPQGKTIKRITTFARPLHDADHWIQCDDLNPPPMPGWIGPPCDGMVLRFGYTALPDDPSDHSKGLNIGCSGKNGIFSSSDRLGCRIQFQY
jgi:hypothetical protein